MGRERVIAAATAFAETSNRQDELFALAFNEHVRAALPPSAPFTSDATPFRAALAGALGAQGRRAMYDVRRIERDPIILGVTSLLWVGATSLSAMLYQVEQSASLERHAERMPNASRSSDSSATQEDDTR